MNLDKLANDPYVLAVTSDRVWRVLMNEPRETVENPMVLHADDYPDGRVEGLGERDDAEDEADE